MAEKEVVCTKVMWVLQLYKADQKKCLVFGNQTDMQKKSVLRSWFVAKMGHHTKSKNYTRLFLKSIFCPPTDLLLKERLRLTGNQVFHLTGLMREQYAGTAILLLALLNEINTSQRWI